MRIARDHGLAVCVAPIAVERDIGRAAFAHRVVETADRNVERPLGGGAGVERFRGVPGLWRWRRWSAWAAAAARIARPAKIGRRCGRNVAARHQAQGEAVGLGPGHERHRAPGRGSPHCRSRHRPYRSSRATRPAGRVKASSLTGPLKSKATAFCVSSARTDFSDTPRMRNSGSGPARHDGQRRRRDILCPCCAGKEEQRRHGSAQTHQSRRRRHGPPRESVGGSSLTEVNEA